jgi:hypothetical protein
MPAILIGGDIEKTVRSVNQRQLVEQFVSLNRTLALTVMPTKERRFGRASRNAPMQRRFTINDHTIGRKVMIRSVMILATRGAGAMTRCPVTHKDRTRAD